MAETSNPRLTFETSPEQYRHWKPAFDGAVDAAYRGSGASLIAAKVKPSTRRVGYAPLEGPENKYRFVRYVERTENLNILKKPKKALPQDVKPG